MKAAILQAARADAVPKGTCGLWHVHKADFEKNTLARRDAGVLVEIPAGQYTYLYRYTAKTMMRKPAGEVVMHDTPDELKTHLEFMLRARGNVLISGLGLGCVVRGCLANPAVKRVTVLENSRDVISLVWHYMPQQERIELIHTEALDWVRRNRHREFDCAWHDLWEEDFGKLQVRHGKLIGAMVSRVAVQGAWKFPREIKTSYQRIASKRHSAIV